MGICSNISNQEAYRLFGTLPADRIEDLLSSIVKGTEFIPPGFGISNSRRQSVL